jgi:hypothetical protein
MAERMEAHRLAKLTTKLHDEETMVIVLEDDKSKKFACFANQVQLNTLLNAIVSLAGRWSNKPNLAVSFEPSTTTECAVRLSVAPHIELEFVVPVNEAIRAMADFVRKINRSGGSERAQ